MSRPAAPRPSGIQLELNFEGIRENKFRTRMNDACFNLLFEVNLPGRELKLDEILPRYNELEFAVSAETRIPCALAVTDHNAERPSIDLCEFCGSLCRFNRDASLIYLNGRNRNSDFLAGELKCLRSLGFKNIAMVSGSVPRQKPIHTLDSVEMLELLREHNSDAFFFPGCAVNPFKYEITATLGQYYKLARKIHTGAAFAVAQFGWDMRKLQELRWQLFQSGNAIPVVSRIMLLSPERAEDICSGRIPGIFSSEDFAAALRREMRFSPAQFEAAQLRRLQLHASGAKILGYTGIQIAGVERPEQVSFLVTMISQALAELKTPEDWIAAHNDYYSHMDMTPALSRFYLFDNLLKNGIEPDNLKFSPEKVPSSSGPELLRYRLAKFLLKNAENLPSQDKFLTKRLLAGCRKCDRCRLPRTVYVCPETCPRGLLYGPCGETDVYNGCPYRSGKECVHARRVRIAVTTNHYELLGL